MKKTGKWLSVAVSTWFSCAAFGAGFQLYTEGSAEALGQAGAISGRTNLTSLAWYNPSALAGTTAPKIMMGSTFASIHTDFSSPSAPDASMSDDWQPIPHFYYVQPISKEWTTMLSINAPYGLITEWPEGWAGQEIALHSELKAIYITPSVAWRPMPMLSVSLGLNVVDAYAELSQYDASPPIGPPGVAVVEGDDINYGGTCSLHFQPLEEWGIGLRYQSSVKLNITGISTIPAGSFPASADLELPSSVNVGLANTSINNLSLGLDLVWTEWSTYEAVAVETPSGVSSVPKNWDNVISIRFGGEYALGESWLLRAGYVWDESPVPDETRAPEMPGSDRQMVMAGFGWKWNRLTIDAAYSYLWAETTQMGTIYPLPGEFETTTHLLSCSFSYGF